MIFSNNLEDNYIANNSSIMILQWNLKGSTHTPHTNLGIFPIIILAKSQCLNDAGHFVTR